MAEERHDPEFLKHIFETTEILRKPVSGIIAGYHVLPYILVGPQEDRPASSVEIRGKIKVSPRLVLAPGRAGQTYGDLFKDSDLMDQALVARVFSFVYSSRHQVTLESEDLTIQRSDRNPQSLVERALDELAQREVINTGVILAPNVRFYPVSLDRFITEILDQESKSPSPTRPIHVDRLHRDRVSLSCSSHRAATVARATPCPRPASRPRRAPLGSSAETGLEQAKRFLGEAPHVGLPIR